MKVLEAHRYALDPYPRTEAALASHVGARRCVFTWALVKERLDASERGDTGEAP